MRAFSKVICAAVLTVLSAAGSVAQQADAVRTHRTDLLRQIGTLLSAGRTADAVAFAETEMRKARSFARTDGRRANAIEIALQVRIADIPDPATARTLMPLAADLVAARRAASPVDQELLASALLTQGTVLFAADRSADADRAFEERLAVLRRAYAADPGTLARHLSMTARNIEEGYGRFERAARLYTEAIALRRGKDDSGRAQAGDMQALGMLEMRLNATEDGERHLTEATDILEAVLQKEPQADDVWQGLVQILVLRAGIAGQRGAPEEAAALLDRAARAPARDAASAHANATAIALGRARVAELEQDWDAAIRAYAGLLTRLRDIPEAQRSDDEKGLILDVLAALAKLHLEKEDTAAARAFVTDALAAYAADDPARAPAFYLLAEIERRDGHPDRQAAAYREALKVTRRTASEQPVHFATNRERAAEKNPLAFRDTAAKSLTFGNATIVVPGGQFSSDADRAQAGPEADTFGATTDSLQLGIQSGPEARDPAALVAAVNAELGRATRFAGSVLVFVHGFNVSFDEALKRTGQLRRDLAFDGPAFVYAWPTAGHWWRYGTDRANATAAADGLASLLTWAATATEARRIHIIAHSMGNRVLLPALATLSAPVRAKIGEVIFASPAVGVGEFATEIDALTAAGFARLTLYASRNDLALRAGFVRELGTTLAGFIPGHGPFVKAGLDTVDVSEGGSATFEFNHDVFAANSAIIDDIRQLLQSGLRPPGKRLPQLVQKKMADGGVYWVYERGR